MENTLRIWIVSGDWLGLNGYVLECEVLSQCMGGMWLLINWL